MLDKFRKRKDEKESATKATDRQAYLSGSIPAWEKVGAGIQRSRGYSTLMSRFKGWVYAAAMINARGVASKPIKLYSTQPRNGMKSIVNTKKISSHKASYLRGEMENKPSIFVQRKMMKGQDVVEVHEHPVLELLDNPSPEMDGYTLVIQRMLNLQLTGNAYLHPIVSETIGVPIELWNMQSDLVTVVPDGELDLVEGYQYGKQPNTVDFNKNEVLHEKQPDPSDPFYGMGWVSAAIDAIDLLNSMDGYEQNVLDNQARPDWAIMVKEHLTDGQYQRLMQQVERQLGGKNNRSRPFIFEGGTDGKPMQFSPQDLAFHTGEARKIEVIAAIAGVPVTKLKANDPNLANAREGNLGWLRDTIVPYLTLDESFLNRQLLPLFGMFAETLFLAYDDPVSADRSQQATIDASDIAAGIRTRNEVRAERGLEPIPDGGDELFVPMGSVPIDVAIENARNPQPMFGTYGTAPKELVEEDEPIDESVELTEAELEGEPKQIEIGQALNGAQVLAALEIVGLVAQGQLPRDAAMGQLQGFFNLTREQADTILGTVGDGFVPEPIIENARNPQSMSGTLGSVSPTDAPSKPSPVPSQNPDKLTESSDRDDTEHAPEPIDKICPDGWHYMEADDLHDTPYCMRGSEHPIATDSIDGCDCKKKHKSTKEMWEESRSLLSQKRAPIDKGNEEYIDTLEVYSTPMGKFRDELVILFRKEVERFLDFADGMGEFVTSVEAEQKIREITDEFVDRIMLTSGQRELDRLGLDLTFNQLDPIVANTLEEYKSQLTNTLIFGTGKEIDDKVKLGMRRGASTDEIAMDILSLVQKEPDTGRIPIEARAEMIARTEVALINEIARLDAWNQSGVVKGKQWVVAAGACESCREMGRGKRAKPIGINDNFADLDELVGKVRVWSPTGEGLQSPPLHPNCRCTMTEILEDEEL